MDFIRIQYWTIPGQNVKVMPTTQKNFGQNNEKEFGIIMAKEVTQEQIEMIEEMVARAQKAAAIIETYDQARVDRLAQAVASPFTISRSGRLSATRRSMRPTSATR